MPAARVTPAHASWRGAGQPQAPCFGPCATGVYIVPWSGPLLPLAIGRYETALVAPLTGWLETAIVRLRRRISLPAPAAYQLRPHLSLSFLGRASTVDLALLRQRLVPLRQTRLRIHLAGVGTFRTGPLVTNLHVRVQPTPRLLGLHADVLRRCGDLGFFHPGRYVGCGYVPHISIFDRTSVRPKDLPPVPEAPWLAGAQARLGVPRIICRRIP